MAITFTNITTANSTSSGATLAASNVTVSAGLWVVIAIAADNAGTSGAASISSVTDSAGNTYTQLSLVNRTAASASNDGTTLGIYLGKINTALSSGSITVNFSPNTICKAMSIKSISVDTAGETLFYEVGVGVTGSGTAYSAGAVSVENGYTIYGATALEQIAAATADSDTTNGSWSTAHTASADTGTNATSQSITTQQKTVTATGGQTYNTSSGSNRDYAVNYVIFYSAFPLSLIFTNLATANSTSSSATLVASNITVPVGDWIIVAIAADNAGTNGAASISSVTDSAGNTYTQLSLVNRTAGSVSNDGTTLGIYLGKINTALSSGSITANFSPNTTCKAMSIKEISIVSGKTFAIQLVGPGVTGSSTTHSTGAVSVENRYTIYAATALEQTAAAIADSDTTNGSWSTAHTASADTGTSATSQSITTQQKTVTATGSQTYNTLSPLSRDYAVNYVIFAPSILGYWAINGVVVR